MQEEMKTWKKIEGTTSAAKYYRLKMSLLKSSRDTFQKDTQKKQRARIDMPGWQVLVFPLCIRYVYPMTYPGNKVDKVLDRV